MDLAGFTLTREEWDGLDEDAKRLLWPDLLEEPYYDFYQVVWPSEDAASAPSAQLDLFD